MPEGKNRYSSDILETSLEKIESLLKGDYGLSKRSVSLLLLQEDGEVISWVKSNEPEEWAKIEEIIKDTRERHNQPLSYIIALAYHEEAQRIVASSIEHLPEEKMSFRERLSRIMINPFTGVPILLLILYYGLYKFVGEFGAGTVVDFIEADIFEHIVNPWITQVFNSIIPWHILRELFVGEYGVITFVIK